MKLFVIAALIAVTAAGRLEHLERSYLPPGNTASNNGFASNQGSFGSGGHDSFGSGGHGSFGNSGGFGTAGSGQPSFNTGHSSGGVSNQYLPPTHSAGSTRASQFGGSGFGAQNSFLRGSSSPNQQYSIPSTSYGTPQNHGSFAAQARPQSQFGATSRQYLAPHANSNHNGQFGATGLGSHAGFSQSGGSRQQFGTSGSQSGAASRQYLAPLVASAQNSGQQEFGGSHNGRSQFGAASRQYLAPRLGSSQNGLQQQLGNSHNGGTQFGAPSHLTSNFGGSHNGGSQFGARFQSQNSGAASRQYLPPNVGGSHSQQPFDEKTGYQY